MDPAGHYAVSTWGNVASNNNIRLVEAARNDGLRIVSGLPKATKVENLRLLTGTIDIRDLARSRAARIYDQALQQPQTPIAAAMAICVSLARSLPDNVRDAATRFLAERGLLPVSRRPFPPPIRKDSEPYTFHCHYTPVTKADAPEIQQQAAYLLINNLRTHSARSGELWTDWSVIDSPPAWQQTLLPIETVMVRFTGGWYRGRKRAVASEKVVRRFESMHGIPPEFLIDYDDGISHAYRRIGRVTNRIVHIIDEESTDEL